MFYYDYNHDYVDNIWIVLMYKACYENYENMLWVWNGFIKVILSFGQGYVDLFLAMHKCCLSFLYIGLTYDVVYMYILSYWIFWMVLTKVWLFSCIYRNLVVIVLPKDIHLSPIIEDADVNPMWKLWICVRATPGRFTTLTWFHVRQTTIPMYFHDCLIEKPM